MSVVLSEIPEAKIVALYGRAMLKRWLGSTDHCSAASEDIEAAMKVQDIFMSPVFRVYTSSDIVGAEIGSSLKNVMYSAPE